MIKIKANLDVDSSRMKWKYKSKKTNSLEHLCIIWNLFDTILEKTPQITEKDLIEMIINRKRYVEELKFEYE